MTATELILCLSPRGRAEVVCLDAETGASFTPSTITVIQEGDGPTIVYLER